MEERAKYTERKSFRLSSRDAYLLKQSGYSPRQAIEYFNRMFYSTEIKGLKIDLINLEEKLKEQELEVAKIKENIRMVKETIENKEQTRFNKPETTDILNKIPLSKTQCLEKLNIHYRNYKKKENIGSIQELPDDLFVAVAKKGNLDVEELRELAYSKYK